MDPRRTNALRDRGGARGFSMLSRGSVVAPLLTEAMGRVTPLVPPPQRDIVLDDVRTLAIGAQIGRGSMATVYRGVIDGAYGVRHAVALKMFDVIASDEHESVLATIGHAARDAACVRHPNVVALHEFGLVSAVQPFVVLELVEGHTLAELLEAFHKTRQRLPLDLALFIGTEIAEALAGARLASSPEGMRLGLVHGELSPTDVLLSWGGEVKVGDFGIAAAARVASTVRSVSSLARRVCALAPEVARGGTGDARSDVFSLGVLLREMMLGPRFPASVTDSQALSLAREGAVMASVFEPQLMPELRGLIERAVEPDPARRYPHAGALAYELRRVALAMGVGDGRSFLRHAMPKAFAIDSWDDEPTGELVDGRSSRPFGVRRPSDADRFSRLRTPPESGTLLRGARWDDDEDGIVDDDAVEDVIEDLEAVEED